MSDEGHGVYFGKDEAVIKGASDSELLSACHAFTCLREGIDCPSDFKSLKWMVQEADSISLIMDSDAKAKASRGYAELTGVLSYIQSQRVDTNNDGKIKQSEVDGNEFFIYPFLKTSQGCRMQPLNNVVQKLNGSNKTHECSEISPAIVLEKAENNSITVEDDRITIRGTDKGLHSGAVIVRDVLAPEWIRKVYNLR